MQFAVAYNRRGIDEVESKPCKSTSKDTNSVPLLDRNTCFGLVASVVKGIIADSVVDLKSPEVKTNLKFQITFLYIFSYIFDSKLYALHFPLILFLFFYLLTILMELQFAVLIELLPLSGIPNGSLVVAVSVLPHDLINTKPKLSIKPLILDAKK